MAERKLMIVTGGGRGIGAAACRLASKVGYAVVVNYARDAGAAEALAAEINQSGGEAVAVQADVSVEADVLRLFSEADRIAPLAALVNNAGVVDVAERVDAMSGERMKRIFDVNILGSFLCAREAVKRLSTRFGGKGGAIVNLSSASAKMGSPFQYVDYAAAKGAIDTFTVGLAKEVADEGVRVNAVRPGIIDTDIHASGGDPDRASRMSSDLPMRRAGTAEEIAKAILWLASDDASYTTGAILDATGGRAIVP